MDSLYASMGGLGKRDGERFALQLKILFRVIRWCIIRLKAPHTYISSGTKGIIGLYIHVDHLHIIPAATHQQEEVATCIGLGHIDLENVRFIRTYRILR